MQRIQKRARPGETIPIEYIAKLNGLYDKLEEAMLGTEFLTGTRLGGERNNIRMHLVVDQMRNMLTFDTVDKLIMRMDRLSDVISREWRATTTQSRACKKNPNGLANHFFSGADWLSDCAGRFADLLKGFVSVFV